MGRHSARRETPFVKSGRLIPPRREEIGLHVLLSGWRGECGSGADSVQGGSEIRLRHRQSGERRISQRLKSWWRSRQKVTRVLTNQSSHRVTSTYRSSPDPTIRTRHGLQHTSQSWTRVPWTSG